MENKMIASALHALLLMDVEIAVAKELAGSDPYQAERLPMLQQIRDAVVRLANSVHDLETVREQISATIDKATGGES